MTARLSVIIPCYNEVETIPQLLAALTQQSIPVKSLEVIVSDGRSEDGTREVVRDFASRHPELSLQIVDNPERSIASALNRAIEATHGKVIARLDAHCVPDRHYLQRCAESLDSTGAANVGGPWEIKPTGHSWISRSIAVAASHPLAAGDARYRIGGPPGEVDTVPFGCFPRHWLGKVGGYDERLQTNEDYELNYRLRMAGGKIWFNPEIRSSYFARPTLWALVRQYARYGFWKARMLRLHPRSLRWRQVPPPLFVLTMASLAIASPFIPQGGRPLGLLTIGYLAVLTAASIQLATSQRAPALIPGFVLSVVSMHLAWGVGFLAGIWKRV